MEEDLPRICYILGGEKTPVIPFEKILVCGAPNNPYHFCADMSHLYDARGNNGDFYVPFIINHPDKIVRRPQFSDDEKALMRLLSENGYCQLYRDDYGQLHAKEYDEMYGPEINCVSMKAITEQFTHSHPFDSATYLESEDE